MQKFGQQFVRPILPRPAPSFGADIAVVDDVNQRKDNNCPNGHADRAALLRWLGNLKQPQRVFLTHGEEDAAMSLAEHVENEMTWSVEA